MFLAPRPPGAGSDASIWTSLSLHSDKLCNLILPFYIFIALWVFNLSHKAVNMQIELKLQDHYRRSVIHCIITNNHDDDDHHGIFYFFPQITQKEK